MNKLGELEVSYEYGRGVRVLHDGGGIYLMDSGRVFALVALLTYEGERMRRDEAKAGSDGFEVRGTYYK